MNNFFQFLYRLITFQGIRQGDKLRKAGNSVFTKDREGREAAWEVRRAKLIKQLEELKSAAVTFKLALDGLEKPYKEEVAKLNKMREALKGAVKLYNQAEEANKADDMALYKKSGADVSKQIKAQEVKVEADRQNLALKQNEFAELEAQYNETYEELKRLPADKASSLAKYESTRIFIETRKRMAGLLSRQEEDPVDLVLQADAEMEAEAAVLSNRVGKEKEQALDALISAAEEDESEDDFVALAAATKAEKASKIGVAAPVEGERTKF